MLLLKVELLINLFPCILKFNFANSVDNFMIVHFLFIINTEKSSGLSVAQENGLRDSISLMICGYLHIYA